jgi:hypothetical protein
MKQREKVVSEVFPGNPVPARARSGEKKIFMAEPLESRSARSRALGKDLNGESYGRIFAAAALVSLLDFSWDRRH